MTLMLGSVTSVEEAEIAVRHGVNIVDLKNVNSGFGAAAAAVVQATVAAVAGRRPVSAVAGEIGSEPDAVVQAVATLARTGVDYVKIGLPPRGRRDDSIRVLSDLARRVRLIGVMFADDGADPSLVPLMARSGFAGAMIDTARKSGARLLNHMDIVVIGQFVEAAHMNGLMAGLAGSLEPPDIPRLLLLAPDVLGFRRALCAGQDRTSRIDGRAIDVVRALIPPDTQRIDKGIMPAAKTDYMLLAARGYSLDSNAEDDEADLIFVRNFALSVRIGAYAHEREKPQNVRFDVEVRVLRSDHVATDIRDVLSYDLITDSIRIIVAQEHISLIEMLAERIAAIVLTFPRVKSVKVRVEKLEVGPGGAGVEIVRHRPKEVASVHHLYPVTVAADGNPTKAT
jgi:(5-formylfuran-3-yl)methyl phosphate synthase